MTRTVVARMTNRRMPHLALVLLAALSLTACNRRRTQYDLFDGLLPAGYTRTLGERRIDMQAARTQTVAIVTSKNFESWASMWVKHFSGRKNGQPNPKPSSLSVATDPSRVTDVVVRELSGRFGTVVSATDFADAREKGANYIALVDLYWTSNRVGNGFMSTAGMVFLDSALRERFRFERETVAPRAQFDIKGTRAFSMLMNGNVQAMQAGISEHLGSSIR